MLRCTLWVQRPNDDNSAEEQRKDAEMLAAYHEAVMAAPRAHVKLKPGEALVFDNCAASKSLHSKARSARPCFFPRGNGLDVRESQQLCLKGGTNRC